MQYILILSNRKYMGMLITLWQIWQFSYGMSCLLMQEIFCIKTIKYHILIFLCLEEIAFRVKYVNLSFVNTVNVNSFDEGQIWENIGKTFHVRVIWTTILLFPNKVIWLSFSRRGKFPKKAIHVSPKRENFLRGIMSTFAVFTYFNPDVLFSVCHSNHWLSYWN